MLVYTPKPEIRIEITDRKCWNDVFTREYANLDYRKQLSEQTAIGHLPFITCDSKKNYSK